MCAGSAISVASASPTAFVAQLRLDTTDRHVDSVAYRDGEDILVDRDDLIALGIRTPDGDRIALSSVPGLSYRFDPEQQALVLTCTSACFDAQIVSGLSGAENAIATGRGGFLNLDSTIGRTGGDDFAAAQMELGLFQPGSFGGASWTIGANGATDIIRLDTQWTWDMQRQRARFRLGDSITQAGVAALPFRFAGVEFGTDFSIDPSFITFPIQSIHGEASAPSVVDLYIDGVRRLRDHVDAGPFSITDAPLIAGAGVAQVVVTDALGRERVFSAPFYASPSMLRPGLGAYAFALGAERENYGRVSDDYGDAIASAIYRRGISDHLTLAAEAESSPALSRLGAGASLAFNNLGQIDAGASYSASENRDGGYAHIGWSRISSDISYSLDVESASQGFNRIGDDQDGPYTRARGTIGLTTERFGAFGLSATTEDRAHGGNVRTFGASYSAPALVIGALSVSALYIDDSDPFTSITIALVKSLGDIATGTVGVDSDAGGASPFFRAQRNAASDDVFGWRVGGSYGARERFDASLSARTDFAEARLEASTVEGVDGLRGTFATGIIFIGGDVFMSRPVRGAFAVVDVGAPNVGVLRERRRIGASDLRGRYLISDLRPYENNRVGVAVDDLPLNTVLSNDEMLVRPAERSGVVVRFPTSGGDGGEMRVVDANGTPLASGEMLVRASDNARFPVGSGGRIYVSNLHGDTQLVSQMRGCRVTIGRDVLTQNAPLRCVGG